jgi:hypothetical protein
MSDFVGKITALVGKNKGSSIFRISEVDDLGVVLTNAVPDVFGNLGGMSYELPFFKKSSSSDKTPLNKETDETGFTIVQNTGDRERMETFDILGNYEQLIYDKQGNTSLSTPFGTKTLGVCVLTVASHSYVVGDYIWVNVTAPAAAILAFNGLHKVTAITATTITYNFGTASGTSASAGIVGNLTITSGAKVAGLVTITTPSAHGFVVGQSVRVASSGATAASFNGVFTIASVPTATTYTYLHPILDTPANVTAGTAGAGFFFSLETLLKSADYGRQFKACYYAPVKSIKASTDIGFNKYVYWLGRFQSEFVDSRESGSSKTFSGQYTPEVLTTAQVDSVLGQLGIKIRVPIIMTPLGVETFEAQAQSST